MLKVIWKILFPDHSEKSFTTVKYAFPLVVITALFASLASVVSESDSYVTIRTDAKTIEENEIFYIDINVTAHIPVNAVDLVISYPNNRISVESIDTGTSVITLWTQNPYAENGNIYLRGGTFRKGFVGEHTIARVRAKAMTSGEARIVIKNTQLVAGDGLGTDVKVTENALYNEAKIIVVTDSGGAISVGASIGLVTDTDGDGDVDLGDIGYFMSAWFTKKSTYDFNGDGRMTFKDFSILLAESFMR